MVQAHDPPLAGRGRQGVVEPLPLGRPRRGRTARDGWSRGRRGRPVRGWSCSSGSGCRAAGARPRSPRCPRRCGGALRRGCRWRARSPRRHRSAGPSAGGTRRRSDRRSCRSSRCRRAGRPGRRAAACVGAGHLARDRHGVASAAAVVTDRREPHPGRRLLPGLRSQRDARRRAGHQVLPGEDGPDLLGEDAARRGGSGCARGSGEESGGGSGRASLELLVRGGRRRGGEHVEVGHQHHDHTIAGRRGRRGPGRGPTASPHVTTGSVRRGGHDDDEGEDGCAGSRARRPQW